MEIQLVHLANGLARAGHRVTLVSVRSSGASSAPADDLGLSRDVELIHLDAHSRSARAAKVGVLRRIARDSDIVHCTGWDTSLWGRIAAAAAGRPVVVAEHAGSRAHQVSGTGAARAEWISLHNRLLDPITATTVICSERQRGMLLAEGVASEKISLIPNGVPVADMQVQARSGFTRDSLGIPHDAKVIAHVASFRAMKRQWLTLETVAQLRKTLDEDVRIVFAGTGPELEDVRARAQAMGADWATFLGPQRNVASVFAMADLTVLPSSAEAMPMVILESIGMGVPVVATDVGDVGAMLGGTGAGVVVPADDPTAFLNAVAVLLSDAEAHDRMTEAALAARAEIDATTMVARYEQIFRRSVAGRGRIAGCLPTGSSHRRRALSGASSLGSPRIGA